MRRSSRNIGLNRFPTIRSSTDIPSPGIRSTCLTPGRFIAARWEIQRPGLQYRTGCCSPSWRLSLTFKPKVADVSWPTATARGNSPGLTQTDVMMWHLAKGGEALLSSYSVCPEERSRCQDRPVRGLERRCPSCAEYMSRANHTVSSSNNSYFRVPTRGRIWNNGQRTLHPISRSISPLPLERAGVPPPPFSPPALLYPFQTSQDQLFMRVAALVRVSTALMLMHSRPPLT